jgi:hypothetical protein
VWADICLAAIDCEELVVEFTGLGDLFQDFDALRDSKRETHRER